MKNQRVKVGIIVVLCTFLICIAGCSKEEKEQESPEQKTLTTVLEMLFTVPDQKLQDAYMEAKEKAEQEAAETTEPGAHGVYDFEELLTKMYGSYFSDQGIESIPYWIYTNLNAYAADRDVKVTFESVNIQPEESSDGNYYTFAAALKYSIGGEEAEYEQTGTALFEDGKIQNITFTDGLMTEIENQLFV
ncbi:MAG TPA: hypothetical protein H9997_07810 [Candidatus Sellimonas avistercoris]|nr:hypothetical protein [Candidatus Sellimonas avistercoris]